MTVVVLTPDLMIASRVIDVAARSRVDAQRIDAIADLPPPGEVRLLVVDWSERETDWGERIANWAAAAPEPARPTVLLFGPHVDIAAHAAAKAARLGPMRARSALVSEVSRLLG